MKRLLTAVLTLLTLTVAASRADAQLCPPSAVVCGQRGLPVYPGMRGGQLVITIGPPPPPPPPPQVVIVRPPPPPQVVIVRPPPPPQYVYVQPQQPRYYGVARPGNRQRGRQNVRGVMGLRFFVAGAGGARGSQAQLAGVGGALRIRPKPHFGMDLGVGFYGGRDHAGRERVEVPFTFDMLAFVNPQSRAQVYFLAGVGTSVAYGRTTATSSYERRFEYFGAETGVGLEFRVRPGFAFNLDARAFVRSQPNGTPEFQRTLADGSIETTRTSAGAMGTAGMTVYF